MNEPTDAAGQRLPTVRDEHGRIVRRALPFNRRRYLEAVQRAQYYTWKALRSPRAPVGRDPLSGQEWADALPPWESRPFAEAMAKAAAAYWIERARKLRESCRQSTEAFGGSWYRRAA